MEQILIAKTMLNIYKRLIPAAAEIDKRIKKEALVIARGEGSAFGQNAERDFDYLAELTMRKVALANLKIYAENALSKMTPELAVVLTLRFIDGFSIKQIAFAICDDVPERTLYRKIDEGISLFSKKLVECGLTSRVFEQMIKNERWILEVAQFLNQKRSMSSETEEEKLLALNELRNISQKTKNRKCNLRANMKNIKIMC